MNVANFLLLDRDRRAVNAMEWDGTTEFTMPEGAVGFVKYDGPYANGWLWNGTELVDPNPPPEEPEQ